MERLDGWVPPPSDPRRRDPPTGSTRQITYTRGQVTITDRPGLEIAACECYGIIRREFDRLLAAAA